MLLVLDTMLQNVAQAGNQEAKIRTLIHTLMLMGTLQVDFVCNRNKQGVWQTLLHDPLYPRSDAHVSITPEIRNENNRLYVERAYQILVRRALNPVYPSPLSGVIYRLFGDVPECFYYPEQKLPADVAEAIDHQM